MRRNNRREFLAGVGRGMLVAGVGYSVAVDMGLSPAFADDGKETLSFGPLEPLAAMMQETPVDRILPAVVERLASGVELGQIVAAAALANARTFGGEDYIGFHTFMALSPAYHMSQELPADRRALPVLKVLYRNTNRLHEMGGRSREVLHPVKAAAPEGRSTAEAINDAIHRSDAAAGEQALAAAAAESPEGAWNDLLQSVEESPDVHRVVLAYRSWDMLGLVGREQAETMLRQSLRYCVKNEQHRVKYMNEPRTLLPKVLDQFKLIGKPRGTRRADDAWIESMSQTLFTSTQSQAAEAVAAALAEGMAPESVAEAISLTANQLVLRDGGRPAGQAQANKPIGSVHGDSIGVHASDSANAWRNIALASNDRNRAASLVLAGYQVALDRVQRGGNFLEWKPRPYVEELAALPVRSGDELLKDLDGAIREKNQNLACALVHRYGESGYDSRPVFDALLKYAISEDGALHAEKYYRTVSDEFAASRPAFRWRQLTALARVTASECGQPAPGYQQACELLKV
ncbi:MAG TPA: hypothetical protein VGN42_25700 [Pirellulales bacterium]|jgi:hypothetical protein|nr:hypothetical protein [Pirellulales bacterium]